jgi:hypothetical protein
MATIAFWRLLFGTVAPLNCLKAMTRKTNGFFANRQNFGKIYIAEEKLYLKIIKVQKMLVAGVVKLTFH